MSPEDPGAGTPPAPSAPSPGPVAPRRRREPAARSRRSPLVFLLAGAVPAAGVAWFLLQPEATRRGILEKIPAGAGGRALAALIALGVLLVLAKVALPAFHVASGSLKNVLGRFQARKGFLRVLLFPAEAVIWFLWLAAQLLFAVDAALTIAAGLVLILLAIRIVKPDLLPSILPELTR